MELLKNLIAVALTVLVLAGAWKVFVKAGRPGWTALIPFYNLFLWIKMAGRPGWWMLLFFVPILNIIMGIIISIDVAKSFGKGIGFALGLSFLPFVFIPLLGFGDASYSGPKI